MNTFAQQPASVREKVFREAAPIVGLDAINIEKDFWVCFTLAQLFTLQNVPTVTFKGAT